MSVVVVFFFCRMRRSPFQKQLWDRIDVNLYQWVLGDILSRIRIPFHLLSQSQTFHLLELDVSNAEIVHAMKFAVAVAVPVIRVRRNTQKRDGLLYQGWLIQNRNIGYGIIFVLLTCTYGGSQAFPPRPASRILVTSLD